MSYTLVDVDITPFSTEAEIAAWIERCEAALRKNPDDEGWRYAMDYVMQIKALADEFRRESAHARGRSEPEQ